jgi:hypothetical protein
MKVESRSGVSDLRAAVGSDRWVALSVVDETLSAAERRFGRVVEGQLLDRFALEAAIDLLSSPSRIVEFIPDLAVRQVQDRVAAGVGTNR